MINDTQGASTLTDHLAELRDRLIRSAWALAICTCACWYFNEQIFNFVRAPIMPFLDNHGLIFTGPMDKFIAQLKVAVMAGAILSCPIWLYQLWMFVAPGLYTHERKYSAMFISAGTILFLAGVAFVYYLVMPMAFKFLFSVGGTTDKPMISIKEYMSFFTTMTLVFGAAFELPLVITLLGVIGIVNQKFLREKRRFAIVGLAVLCAIITPPDLLSMLMLLGPMWFLYEISIIIVGLVERKKASASQ